MVLLKDLFREACEKYGYNDYWENELYFSKEGCDEYRMTMLRKKIDEKGGLEYLKQSKKNGKTLQDLCDEFNCSTSGIYNYLRVNKTTWRNLLPYSVIKAGKDVNGNQIYWLRRVSDNQVVRTSINKKILYDLMNDMIKMEE